MVNWVCPHRRGEELRVGDMQMRGFPRRPALFTFRCDNYDPSHSDPKRTKDRFISMVENVHKLPVLYV